MTQFKRKVVDTPSGRVSYLESGSDKEKVVLFLHGIAGNARSFRRQLLDLPNNNYRVLAWDAPGYGESSAIKCKDPSNFMQAYAHIVCDFLDGLGLKKLSAIVGVSMGGIVVQCVAGLYPDRVETLVITSSYIGDAMPPEIPLAEKWTSRIEDLKLKAPQEFGVARAAGMLPTDEQVMRSGRISQDEFDSIRNKIASIASEVTPDGLIGGCTLLHVADTRVFASDFTMPVLVIIGELDRVIAPEKTRKLADLMPHCDTLFLPGVAHAAYLEDPETFNAALVNFIK